MQVKESMLLSLVLIAGVSVAHAQTKHNGNWWARMSDSSRLQYVVGYLDCLGDGQDLAVSRGVSVLNLAPIRAAQLSLPDMPDSTTYQTVMAGMNLCYADFRNQSLPIITCMLWVKEGIAGVSDAEREAFLLRERKTR